MKRNKTKIEILEEFPAFVGCLLRALRTIMAWEQFTVWVFSCTMYTVHIHWLLTFCYQQQFNGLANNCSFLVECTPSQMIFLFRLFLFHCALFSIYFEENFICHWHTMRKRSKFELPTKTVVRLTTTKTKRRHQLLPILAFRIRNPNVSYVFDDIELNHQNLIWSSKLRALGFYQKK